MRDSLVPMKLGTVELIVALTLGLLTTPLPTEAQRSEKVSQIGVLSHSSRYIEIFVEELWKYGWIEGQNLLIEYRFAERKVERLPELAAELARLQLDLIVTVTTTATRAAIQVIKTTPIVFTLVADPVSRQVKPRRGG